MNRNRSNAVVAHGGGPTAVINASLAGVIETFRGGTMWGARYGVQGLLSGDFVELSGLPEATLRQIEIAPGSVIGSSRRKLADEDYASLLRRFDERGVGTFFYTGGNGSMDTALRVKREADAAGYDLRVIGIPKTIDNDLCVTDHTPGYLSTAHFFAIAAREVGEDNRALPSPICVLEVLGRNAGWVVGATALARVREDDSPHLIYMPEKRVSLDSIAADCERVYRKLGRAVITVCEGQLDESGVPFGADVDRATSDVHRLASNLGHTLARLLTEKLVLRARAEKPGLLGRCCGPFAVERDRKEAYFCGQTAAQAAMDGRTGVMAGLRRDGSTFLIPLEQVARKERLVPEDWVSDHGQGVSSAFLEYLRELIPPVPGYVRI